MSSPPRTNVKGSHTPLRPTRSQRSPSETRFPTRMHKHRALSVPTHPRQSHSLTGPSYPPQMLCCLLHTHTRRSAGCRRLTPAEPAHTHLGPWSRPEAGTARAAASELRPAGRRRRAAPASGKCSRLGDDGAAAPGLGPLTSQGPSGFGSGPRGTTHRPPPGSHCAHPKAFGDRLPDSECAGAASPGWAGLAEPDARGGDGAGRVLGG